MARTTSLPRCECADQGCPAHKGATSCGSEPATTLFRTDQEDLTGTKFCEDCASDAHESGLFSGVCEATDSVAGVHCSDCGEEIMEGDEIKDRHIFKSGELDSIEILHATCNSQDGEDEDAR